MEKEDSISKLASYGRDSERGNDVLYSKLVPSGKSPQPKPSGPPETVDTDGLDDKEADLVREAAGILDGYRRDRALYGRISGAGTQHL